MREIRREHRALFSTQRSNLYLVGGHLGTVSFLQLQDLPLRDSLAPRRPRSRWCVPAAGAGTRESPRGWPRWPRAARRLLVRLANLNMPLLGRLQVLGGQRLILGADLPQRRTQIWFSLNRPPRPRPARRRLQRGQQLGHLLVVHLAHEARSSSDSTFFSRSRRASVAPSTSRCCAFKGSAQPLRAPGSPPRSAPRSRCTSSTGHPLQQGLRRAPNSPPPAARADRRSSLERARRRATARRGAAAARPARPRALSSASPAGAPSR